MAMVRLIVGYRWVCVCGWESEVLHQRGYRPSPDAIPIEGWLHAKDCDERLDPSGWHYYDRIQDVTIVEIEVLAPYEISYVGAQRLNRR